MQVASFASERLISGTLGLIAEDLQLGRSRFAVATQAYRGATTWLAADGSPIRSRDPHLFPHGSLALDTTVRPIFSSEFDLDVICRVRCGPEARPSEIYKLIWDRMYEHGTYRPLMEEKPRCIRLSYADTSQFHLDIVPAIPDKRRGGTFILIPDGSGDLNQMVWKTANPEGFKDWFEKRKVLTEIKHARAHIAPLGEPLPAEQKAVLTKSVQLVKRWRDVRWADDPENGTPSIVLTCLAASIYSGQTSLAHALDDILDGLVLFAGGGETEIFNPVNAEEVISEKWIRVPDSHEAFVEGVRAFRSDWNEVLEIAEDARQGIPALTKKLEALFGEPVAEAVKRSVYTPIEDARPTKSLQMEKATGLLVPGRIAPAAKPSYASYKTQTFYGD